MGDSGRIGRARCGYLAQLRNDQIVQELVAGGAPIEVRVALDRDAATPSGKYTLATRAPADSASAVTKTVDIDVTTADSTGTAFAFP